MHLKFENLIKNKSLLDNITKMGFEDATQVQEESYPHLVAGSDVAGLAQTGTGKTAAFLIPFLERYLATQSEAEVEGVKPYDTWNDQNFVLVLTPTRELAEQIFERFNSLSEGLGLKSLSIIGGRDYESQTGVLSKGVQLVIATPGRLIDLQKQKALDLNACKTIIFDEADRMFDMGFRDDMCYILDRVPKSRQLMFFSATMNFEVLEVAYEYGSDPVEINIGKDSITAENIDHTMFHVGKDEKPKYLLSLIAKEKPKQIIVFSNFKRNIPKIEKFLNMNGIKAMGISSSLSQNQRSRVMDDFREGRIRALIATDVAARGLDVKGIDLVVNYEIPSEAEAYVHRIGRTGRAGESGKAYSLCTELDIASLSRVEDYLGEKVKNAWIEDSEFVKDFKAFPYRYDPKREFETVKNLKNERFDKKNKPTKKPYTKKHEPRDEKPKDFKARDSKPKDTKKTPQRKKKAHTAQPPKKVRVSKARKTSSRFKDFKPAKTKKSILARLFGWD